MSDAQGAQGAHRPEGADGPDEPGRPSAEVSARTAARLFDQLLQATLHAYGSGVRGEDLIGVSASHFAAVGALLELVSLERPGESLRRLEERAAVLQDEIEPVAKIQRGELRRRMDAGVPFERAFVSCLSESLKAMSTLGDVEIGIQERDS